MKALEVKVGIFVLLGILSLFLLSTQVNSFSNFQKEGYHLHAYIDDATGLEFDSKVIMRGINIGTLENKELFDGKVKLTLFIYDNVKVPDSSKLTLTQDSMLSQRYIKILPSKSKVFLEKNAEIKDHVTIATFDQAVDSINGAAIEFKNFMAKLNEGINEEVIKDFQSSIKNLNQTFISFKGILKENREALKGTIDNLNSVTASVQKRIDSVMLRVESLAKEFDTAGKSVNKKLPDILKQIDELSREFAQVGKTLNKKLPSVMENADKVTDEFAKTGATINEKLPTLLSKFETVENKFMGIEDNLTDILVENKKPINDAIKSADGFFSTGESTFVKLEDYFAALQKSQLDVEVNSRYMSNDAYFKTYATVYYRPTPTKYYILGMRSMNDYTDPDKFNKVHEKSKTYIDAQLGKRFSNLLLRGGIIENTGGLGFDYFMNKDSLRFGAEVYDFNAVNDIRGKSAHLGVYLRYRLLKHLDLFAGYDNALNADGANAYFGMGISFSDDDLKLLLGSSGGSFLK